MSNANVDWDPNEPTAVHYRLFSLAIRVKGLAQIWALYPYLEAKLNQIVARELEPQVVAESKRNSTCLRIVPLLTSSSGWSSVQIAPLIRECATGLLGVYMFGDTLCRSHLV